MHRKKSQLGKINPYAYPNFSHLRGIQGDLSAYNGCHGLEFLNEPLRATLVLFGDAEIHGTDAFNLGFQDVTRLELFLKLGRIGISGRN